MPATDLELARPDLRAFESDFAILPSKSDGRLLIFIPAFFTSEVLAIRFTANVPLLLIVRRFGATFVCGVLPTLCGGRGTEPGALFVIVSATIR